MLQCYNKLLAKPTGSKVNTSFPLRKAFSGVLVIMQKASIIHSDKTAVLEASGKASSQTLSLSSELQERSVSFMTAHAV